MTNKEIVQALRCSATRKEKEKCEMRRKNELGCLRCFSRSQEAAANVIEQLDAENAKAEAERDALPPGTRVIATDDVFVGEAIYALDGRWNGYGGGILRDCIGSVITRWMPLPPVPKKEER